MSNRWSWKVRRQLGCANGRVDWCPSVNKVAQGNWGKKGNSIFPIAWWCWERKSTHITPYCRLDPEEQVHPKRRKNRKSKASRFVPQNDGGLVNWIGWRRRWKRVQRLWAGSEGWGWELGRNEEKGNSIQDRRYLWGLGVSTGSLREDRSLNDEWRGEESMGRALKRPKAKERLFPALEWDDSVALNWAGRFLGRKSNKMVVSSPEDV